MKKAMTSILGGLLIFTWVETVAQEESKTFSKHTVTWSDLENSGFTIGEDEKTYNDFKDTIAERITKAKKYWRYFVDEFNSKSDNKTKLLYAAALNDYIRGCIPPEWQLPTEYSELKDWHYIYGYKNGCDSVWNLIVDRSGKKDMSMAENFNQLCDAPYPGVGKPEDFTPDKFQKGVLDTILCITWIYNMDPEKDSISLP